MGYMALIYTIKVSEGIEYEDAGFPFICVIVV